MSLCYKQNLVFQLRALRLPVAGRTVANCGLSGPQLRDEEKDEALSHFAYGKTTFFMLFPGEKHEG